jgi:cytidylate kinase
MAPLIIAISGKSGCGNSTVSKLLAARLGVKLINHTFREMAAQKGIDFEEMLRLANADPEFSYDRTLDREQVALAHAGDCVIGSRLAMWLLPDATLRLYLAGSLEVRAARIHEREGAELADKLAFTRERDHSDHERYLRIYGINNDDISPADLVVNTELWRPEDIVDLVATALAHMKPR